MDKTGLSDTGRRSKSSDYEDTNDQSKEGLGNFNAAKSSEQRAANDTGYRSKGDEC